MEEKENLKQRNELRREPKFSPPERFHLGDDFYAWEMQTRMYIKQFRETPQRDVVLSLLSREAFSKVIDCRFPDDIDQFFQLLRRHVGGLKPSSNYVLEFNTRMQRSDECVTEFVRQLVRLAHSREFGRTEAEREQRILQRIPDGLLSEMNRIEFILRPPKSLDEAEELAIILDEVSWTAGNSDLTTCSTTVALRTLIPPNTLLTASFRVNQHYSSTVVQCYHCEGIGHLARMVSFK